MNRWMAIATVAFVLCNLGDAAFTTYWLQNNLAIEANPIMAYLIDINIKLFLAVKVLIGMLCPILIHIGYQISKARWLPVVWACVVSIYALVMVHHLHGVMLFLRN